MPGPQNPGPMPGPIPPNPGFTQQLGAASRNFAQTMRPAAQQLGQRVRTFSASLVNDDNSEVGFFDALFDVHFNHFITVQFARVLYSCSLAWNALIGVVIVFAGLVGGVAMMSSGEDNSFLLGLMRIIVCAVVSIVYFLVTSIVARLSMEFAVATIRTAQNSTHIREELRRP